MDFDATSQPEGKTSEAAARSAADVGCTDAAHHEWPRPRRPLFQNELVREVAMELVQHHPHIGGRATIFQMDMSVLSCPAEFDQVFFVEACTDCHAVARIRVKDDIGAWFLPILSCRKGHAGSITDKRGQVEAKGLALRLLIGSGLGSKSARVKYDDQDEEAPSQAPEMAQDTLKNSFRLVRGVIHSVVPILDFTPALRFVDQQSPFHQRRVGEHL